MTNKPTATLRDGSLKATIWHQKTDQGGFYRVTFVRGYRDDDGNWHDSDSFSGAELLRLANLAARAYDETRELRAEDREGGDQPADGRRS